MVGFCGVVGDFDHGLHAVSGTVVWSNDEAETSYFDDDLEVFRSAHAAGEAESQPGELDDETLLWIWGDVIGWDDRTEYVPRPSTYATDVDYCVDLLERNGHEFVDGLNSEFAGVIYDRTDDEAILFTDRLGARPLYYAELDGALLFSTHPNTVLAHPKTDPAVNDDLLVEYLTFERVFGTETPFEPISKLHPGSRLTYDLNSGSMSVETYWVPEYEPTAWTYDDLVATFSDVYARAVEERTDPDADSGVLISGGSDSRLLLSELGAGSTGYHMNERMNTEAKTAKRVCETVGADFRFLERDSEYQKRVLSCISPFLQYTSFFDQAHAAGFDGVLRSEVDELFCGQYSDTLLSGHYAPTAAVRLPVLGWNVPVPRARSISDVDDYCDFVVADHSFTRGSIGNTPDYIGHSPDAMAIFRRYVEQDDGRVVHHGVTYPSFESLCVAGGFYPLTNAKTYLFYYSLTQIAPTHYPFLDNRIVDLALSMPRQYHVRRNVVNDTLKLNAPILADVPHAETGLPLTYPSLAHTAVDLFREFAAKVGIATDGYDGAWSDHNRVLRESDIVSEYLFDGDGPDCWDGVNPDRAREIYDRHLDGENRYFELYGLLSLCNSYPFDNPGTDE